MKYELKMRPSNRELSGKRERWLSIMIMFVAFFVGRLEGQGITRVPQDFKTIQAAIDNGPYSKVLNPLPGWPLKELEIKIEGGTYAESLRIREANITLRAQPNATVLINGGADSKPFVDQGAQPSYFSAFGIVFTNFAMARQAGNIFINTSGSNSYVNCKFVENQGSLFASNGNLSFRNCVFTNNYIDVMFNGGSGSYEINQCTFDCGTVPVFYQGMNMALLVTNSIVTSIGSTILGGWGTRHFFINSVLSFQTNAIFRGASPAYFYIYNSIALNAPVDFQYMKEGGSQFLVAYSAISKDYEKWSVNNWFLNGKSNIYFRDAISLNLDSDFRLKPKSPLLRAGSKINNEFQVILKAPDVDINNKTRDYGDNTVDIGPFHGVFDNPVVIESPSAKTVVAGETLSLSASMSGYSVAFRWQKDGVSLTDEGRIHGSATTTLVVTGVDGGDAGVYRLVGTNLDGKAITAGAAVTVLIPPTITMAPQSVDVFDGDPLTLRVAANGSSSLTYQWFKDGVAVDGQRGVSLEINRSQQSDAGSYYVVVSNSVASVVSAKAEVTFIPGIHVFAGGIPIQGSFVANDKFSLELQYANADWLLFYTLDNSVPDFLSRPYTGRFDVTTAANLRVIAYAPDFSRYLTSGPLEIRFLQQQLIDWGTVPTLRFGDVASLTANASSGLPVVFSVISGPATVNGAQLRATGAGVVVLRASQAGSDVFAPASETRTLTINRASQTLVWPELLPRKFGDSPFAVAVTSTGGLPVTLSLDAGKAVVANGLVTLTGVGTVNLIATQAGDVNREPVSEVRTFTVGKAEQTISFPSPVSRAFSTDVFQLTAVSSSKLPVTIEVLSGPLEIVGGGLRATGVGSAVIRARQPGNENYEAAISAEGTLKITQGIQTLAFAEVGPKTFGDAPVTLKATSSAGLPVIFRVESGPGALVGDVLTLTGAGTVVVQATQSGLATYDAASASQSITVAKAAQSISFNFLAPVGYTTNAIELTGTASSGLPVNYRLVSGSGKISGTSITLLGIGNISVAAEQNGDDNYRSATSVTNSFAVSRGAQSITFEQIPDQLVPNQPIFLSAKSSAGLPVAYAVLSGPATINGNVLKILNGGQVTVRALNFGSPLYLAALQWTGLWKSCRGEY